MTVRAPGTRLDLAPSIGSNEMGELCGVAFSSSRVADALRASVEEHRHNQRQALSGGTASNCYSNMGAMRLHSAKLLIPQS